MVPIQYSVRSLWVRKITTIATALGVALVIFVFAGSQMVSAGMKRAMKLSGREDTVILLRDGSDAELPSSFSTDKVKLVGDRPEVRQGDGHGAIGEIVVVLTIDLVNGDGISNLMVRGTELDKLAFRPEVKIVSGRLPKPGTNEAMVGKAISGRFKGVRIGQQFDIKNNRPLNVVGVFSAGGSSYESEVWGDLDEVRRDLGREGVVSSARVRLKDKGQLQAFRSAVEADKQLGIDVMRETAYYEKQSEMTAGFLGFMGSVFAVLLSLAAMIFAAITMNGAVANRTKEIGTLRALGFSRLAILTSFVIEAIFLSVIGGAIGTAFGLLLSLQTFKTMNFATFSEIVITFHATPGMVIGAFVFSVIMGLIGGLAPAIRAARVSPVEAMRA
jgi:putative ABC transport system permease protein